ncbi:CZB domain-containing protein [Gammaproteobacteria bacterium]
MDTKTRLDIGTARIVHLNWTLALESMVSNPHNITEIQSHMDCELGRWIYTKGLRDYGDFDAIRLLMRTHQHFHEVAHEMMEARLKGEEHLTEKLQDIRILSRDIVYFLTELELDILERKHQQKILAHPFQSLINRLFNGPYHALPDDHGPLNVSYARLVHLNWTRGLTKSFRGWGQDAHLESAEDCALGDWLHTTAESLSNKHVEISQLKAVHKKFHVQAEETILFLSRRRENLAQASYTKTLELSRVIIYLLSMIELILLDSGMVIREDSVFE